MRRIAFLFLLFPFALSAQEGACTILGVQDLSALAYSLQNQIDSLHQVLHQITLEIEESSISGESLFSGIETPHAALDFLADTVWVVPAGVHSLELSISGGKGGDGGSTVGPYNNNQNGCAFGNLNGGSGGRGGFFRGLLNVSEGDSLVFLIGSNGIDGYTSSSWNANGTNGTSGTESKLKFGDQDIIVVTGGGGGEGQQCYTGYYNGQHGDPGSNGGIQYGLQFGQTGFVTLETVPQAGAYARVRY